MNKFIFLNLSLAYNIFYGRLEFPQRNGTYEGTTSRYVTVVFVYCGGKQQTP